MAVLFAALQMGVSIFCLPVSAQSGLKESSVQTSQSVEGESIDLDRLIEEKLDTLWEEELSDSIPQSAQEILQEQKVEKKGISGILSMTPEQVFELLLDKAKEQIREPISVIGKVIGVMILCSVLGAVQHSGISGQLKNVFTITAAAGVVTFLSEPVLGCIRQTVVALRESSLFLLSFNPVMSGLVIAGGHPASGGAYQMILLFASQILSELASRTLIPLLCIYLALCIMVPVAPFLHLEQVTGGIKSVVCWGLGILTTIFVGMLSIQTIVGSGGDSLMLKASKFLVGSFIPVIGGTISDAVGAAKGCVQVLKSVVGSFGILVAVLSFLPALLEVCLWYLAVRVLAWVGLMLDAKEVSSLLSSIAQTFSILLAMIGCFMLLVLVSTTLMLMMTVGSGLGRVLKLSISVFFLCSLLLPLGALELDFSDVLQTSQQEKSYELSEEITQEVNTEVYQMMERQVEGEVQNFLSQKGITPVQINIDILQQGDSVMLMLDLLLEEKDRPMQAWVEEQMSSDLVQVSIHYTEGEKNDG